MIIDGGAADWGLESTILDVSEDRPVLLRPGAVTQEMIEKRLGRGLDTMTAEDLTDYIGIFNSLKDKNTKVSEWFEYEKISTDISAEIDQLQTEKEQVL